MSSKIHRREFLKWLLAVLLVGGRAAGASAEPPTGDSGSGSDDTVLHRGWILKKSDLSRV